MAQEFGSSIGLRTEMTLNADTFIWVILMASTITLWTIIRILTTERRFGLSDGLNRLSFSFWFLFYPLVYGASELPYLFLGAELVWAVSQLWGYRKTKSQVAFAS